MHPTENSSEPATPMMAMLLRKTLVCCCSPVITAHCGALLERAGLSQHARRDVAENAVLGPIRRELLAPEAVELACRLIRDAARAKLRPGDGADSPEGATMAAEIAELEELIASRPALAHPLRLLVAERRERIASLRRAEWRRAHTLKLDALPAEAVYRAVVGDMASAVLAGSNVEAARAAVRGLTGDIPVFEKGGKLYARLAVDAAPLFSRCNPEIIEQVGSGGRI